MGKNLRKARLSEAGIRPGRDIEGRARTTSVGIARTSRVILGIFPCDKITQQNRAANSVKSAIFTRRG